MYTLFIKPTLGFDMNSLPEGLLNIMTSVDVGGDGTIQLTVEDPQLEQAREVLSESYDGVISFNATGSSVVVDVVSEPAEQEDHPVEADNTDREIAHEGINADNREDAELEDTAEVPPEATHVKAMVGPSQIEENRVTDERQVYAAISQVIGGESVNNAKQLDDSLRDISIYMNKILALNKRVAEATKMFSENSPEVVSLVQQASEISANYELVEEVYFTDTEVVFKTTPLVTDDRWDGHKRLIGVMRIGIRLDALFNPNPTSDKNTISIKNLTHRYSSSKQTIWECGHVKSNGITCFGTAFNAVFEAICARDLTYIVESMVRFIKTPNPDDSWGYHIKYWPEAPTAAAQNAYNQQ